MTTITSYLQTNASGTVQVLASTWVQFKNNNTNTLYVSDAASDANGKYTMTGLPSGTYTVAIGPTNVGPWTATGNTSYQVEPVDSTGAGVIPSTLTVGTVGDQALTAGATTLGSLTIGTGTSLGYGTPIAAQLISVTKGTSGSPDTVAQPLLKVDRTMSLTTGQVAGDGSNSAAAIQGNASTPASGQVQPIGVMGLAASAASLDPSLSGPDACGGYFVGRSLSGSNRLGIGLFSIGRAEPGSTGGTSGIQVASYNATGVDQTVNTNGFSSGGIDIVATSLAGEKSAVGILLDNPFNTQFKVGLHFNGHNTGASAVNSILVDDTSPTSILINGTHSTAALAVKAGSGPILIGGTAVTASGALLEIQGANATTDPVAQFGSTSNLKAYAVRVRNSQGNMRIFVAGGSNDFLTGTIAGDVGLSQTNVGKFIHIGGSASAFAVGNDNSVTFTSKPLLNAGATFANNVGILQFKDTAGTAITGITAPNDNTFRVGWTLAPATNGHLIFMANGLEAMRWTPVASAHALGAIGTGDPISPQGVGITGQLLDIRSGTSGAPDTTAKPLVYLSRTFEGTTGAPFIGSPVDQVATISGNASATLNSQIQVVGISGYADTLSTQPLGANGAADATGISGVAFSNGSSTRLGIGGFFLGSARGNAAGAQGRVSGIQVAAENRTGLGDKTVAATAFSGGGIWVTAGNSFDMVGTAIEIGNSGITAHGVNAGQFDVGLHFNGQVANSHTGAILTASIQDDSTAATSLLINGTHATAAMAVANGSGPVLIGEATKVAAAALLEVNGQGVTSDPLVNVIGGAAAAAIRLSNNSGGMKIGASFGVNNFMTGSQAGDIVFYNFTSSKRLLFGGPTLAAMGFNNDGTTAIYPNTATPAGGATTAHLDFGSTPALGIYFGSGAPTVSTPQGSVYLRTDGIPYYNTNSTTGWSPLMADVGQWTAADHGFISWNYAPEIANNTLALTPAGTVFVQRIHVKKATTITNINLWMSVIGSALTSNQCLAGFYDSGGNLLSATADQSARWVGSLGQVIMALTTPQAVAAGDYYTALFYNGTTGPTFQRAANTNLTNVNLAGASMRFSTANTGQTTSMPSLLSGYAAVNAAYWVALS